MKAVWISLSLLVPAAGALAQQQPVAGFVTEVKVNNINVDVQVKDANGVPVTGLRREDFRVFENDAGQEITNFVAVEGGQVSAAREEALVGQAAAREVVLFFDLYLLSEPDKSRVLQTIRDQLAIGLAPGETVAVVSFDGALRVHTPPTASAIKVVEALKEVDRVPATGLQRQISLSSYDVRDTPRRESWSTFQYRRTQNLEYWSELRRMVGRVENAFTAAIQRFSETQARKVVLLISPGFPRAENVPMYRDYDFWLDTPVEYRNAGLFGRAAMLASELEYTLYTLDPSGNQIITADASVGRPPQFADVANVKFWREADRKDSLIQAARLTGGEAIFTGDGGVALADVERVTSSYYSLAYQPDHAGDGKEYAIRVEAVGHPDWKLTYRTRYIDRPFELRDAERSRAALLTGLEQNPLGIELVLDKPTSRMKLGVRGLRAYRINAEVRIPYAKLTMLPRGEISWGQVQVVIVGVDLAGNQSDLGQQLVPIEIASDKLAEARSRGYFSFKFALEVDKGPTSLRVAVNDVLAHSTSTIMADLKF